MFFNRISRFEKAFVSQKYVTGSILMCQEHFFLKSTPLKPGKYGLQNFTSLKLRALEISERGRGGGVEWSDFREIGKTQI